MHSRLPAALAAVTVAGLGLSASAQAADVSLLPTKALSFSAPAAVANDCRAAYADGTAGVDRQTITAPAEGYATLRLDGPAADDWDLALFDAKTGYRLAGSEGFRSNEVVQSWARAGQKLVLQACRRAGDDATMAGTFDYAITAWPEAPATKSVVVDIPLTDTRTQVPQLDALGLDVDESVTSKGAKAIVTKPYQLDGIKALGLDYKVLDTDLLGTIQKDMVKDQQRAAASAGPSNLPSGHELYRKLADYQAELKKLVADHPAIVKPVTLPKPTFQGKDTMGVEISADVNRTDDQKPTSFIMGIHHAREWPAGEVVQELAYYLAQEYGKDDEVTALLNRTRVVIVPVINGDGFVASREAVIDPADSTGNPDVTPGLIGPGINPELAEGALIPAGGTLAYRRKNCDGAVPSGSVPCDIQVGVDPNRNYGFLWGGKGASSSPNSQSYRGTGPWSEPETQAVHEFSQVHDVTSLMTVHTIAALVLRPPGLHDNGMAPDEDHLKVLGDAMAEDTGYTSQYSYQLYDTSGTTEDWNYGAAGTFGYTIELGPGATDDTASTFHGTFQEAVVDQFNGTGEREGRGMRRAFLRMIGKATDRADFSTLKGTAPAGAILRVKKTFKTDTSAVCTTAGPIDVRNDAYACLAPGAVQSVDDKLDYTTKVAADGTFDWIVTPSTRPFVLKSGKTEAWTLTCEDTTGKVYETREVTIGRGQSAQLDLPCGGLKGTTPPGTTTPGDTTPAPPTTAPSITPPPGTTTTTTTTTPGPGTTPPPTSKLIDKLAPRSRFAKQGAVKASRSGITLRGTSTDVAPKGLKKRLKKVYVSVGLRVGEQCRFLSKAGVLGPVVSCARTTYVAAKGTKHWRLRIKHAVPAGRYLAWIRGVDAARNKERKSRTRNLKLFSIA